MDLVFSTNEVDRAERLATLQEIVSGEFLGLQVNPLGDARGRRDFEASVSTRDFDGLKVARFSGTPTAARRTNRHIAASIADDYLLALHTKGLTRARQGGREVTLHPGDLALLDSARPYAIELIDEGRFEHIAFRIPRPWLDARADRLERALAVRVSAASDAGRLLSPYLRTVASRSWQTDVTLAAPLIETGLDLLVNALVMAAGLDLAVSRQAEMLHTLKQYSLRRLADRDLSPASVAAANYVSTRQLHRVFAREDISFGAWLRRERLRRCRRDLADRRLADRSIAEIAARWGYCSPAHFTRVFQARYGIGPREFRLGARLED
jgi:AraC-like DNA-binding protein